MLIESSIITLPSNYTQGFLWGLLDGEGGNSPPPEGVAGGIKGGILGDGGGIARERFATQRRNSL